MAHDAGIFEEGLLARQDLEIRAADADMADAHQHLARAPHRHRAGDERKAPGFFAQKRFHRLVLMGGVAVGRGAGSLPPPRRGGLRRGKAGGRPGAGGRQGHFGISAGRSTPLYLR